MYFKKTAFVLIIILAPKLKHSHSENQESHSPHAAVLVVEVTARGRRGHGPPGLIYCRLTRCLFCKIMRTGDDMYRLNQQTVGGQSVIFTTILFIFQVAKMDKYVQLQNCPTPLRFSCVP